MREAWLETLSVLDDFSQVTEPSRYVPLPDDWCIGLSDVVNSTAAIQAGRYRAVNLAGAGTISAVSNALRGDLHLFSFGGDGASFAVSGAQAKCASDALSRVAIWARRDLDLDLRVALISVAEIRSAGSDVRAAFWRASSHVQYAMFMGGGLEWSETQLKSGVISLAPADIDQEPDLTGLSCQWAPIQAKNGKILSLIVRPAPGAPHASFAEIVSRTIVFLENSSNPNPMPSDGPDVRWPATAIGLQSRISRKGRSLWLRRLHVSATAAFIWFVFKIGIRIAGFDPARYRREMVVNSDFRKFDGSLMMTIDCAPDVVTKLRDLLDTAVAEGTVRYGLHLQDEALITCVAPSVQTSAHVHFVDGSDGGYASAAAQIR
jgi:Protein of unknown function (DUF3095)